MFIKRIGELLNEGYTFSEAVHLVLPFHTDEYQAISEKIRQLIKKGRGVYDIFKLLGFSNQLLLSLYVAEKSGSLANCLTYNASYMKKMTEAKKKAQQLLTYPIILFLILSGMMFGFRRFFLPNLMDMQTNPTDNISLSAKLLPHVAVRLPDLFIGGFVLIICSALLIVTIYHSISAKKKVLFMQRIPLISRLFFLWKTQQLTLELGSLLNSGLTIQEALAILKKQETDLLLQEIARQLQFYVQRGESLHAAVRLQSFLPKEFSIYIEHGEMSGHLGKELIIYSDNLLTTIQMKMSRLFQLIQPMMFLLIACCIIAAYLALLLPMYQMIDSI